jgi:hypothetical protein
MNRILVILLILFTGFLISHVFAFELENPADIKRISQVGMLRQEVDMSDIGICILDTGVSGIARIRDRLSKNIQLIGEESEDGNFHAIGMAQIVMAASGAADLPEEKQPQIAIVPAVGYTQLKKAIETCIESETDIILYSNNWEWSSNFNGDGFVNDLVNMATEAGILWINAAGNNGGLTYHANVEIADEKERRLALPDAQDTLRITNTKDNNIINITLSWNDFGDIKHATKKDLDFVLYQVLPDPENPEEKIFKEMGAMDESGKGLMIGQKRQIGRHRKDGDPEDVTGNALETAELLIDKGEYALRVHYASAASKFSEDDQFRIILRSQKPDGLEMKSASRQYEITPPADNENVIAVGVKEAPFSARGPRPDGLVKPDVVLDMNPQTFMAKFSDGSQQGPDTSNAAAIFAGVVVALKGQIRDIALADIKNYLRYLGNMQSRMPVAQANMAPGSNPRNMGQYPMNRGNPGQVYPPRSAYPQNNPYGRQMAPQQNYPHQMQGQGPQQPDPAQAPAQDHASGPQPPTWQMPTDGALLRNIREERRRAERIESESVRTEDEGDGGGLRRRPRDLYYDEGPQTEAANPNQVPYVRDPRFAPIQPAPLDPRIDPRLRGRRF